MFLAAMGVAVFLVLIVFAYTTLVNFSYFNQGRIKNRQQLDDLISAGVARVVTGESPTSATLQLAKPKGTVSWTGRQLEADDPIYENPNLEMRNGDYIFTFTAHQDFGGEIGTMISSQTYLVNLKGRRSHEFRLESILR